MRNLLFVLFSLAVFSGAAEARNSIIVCDMRGCNDFVQQRQQVIHHRRIFNDGEVVGHPAGCPWSQSCGCIASVKIFGHPVRELYLAANWFRFSHASPGPGMVAVRAHHVFVILNDNGDGTVMAYDGNSGHHQTRIHTVSLRGYSVRDPSSTMTTHTRHRMSAVPVSRPRSHGRSVDESELINSFMRYHRV